MTRPPEGTVCDRCGSTEDIAAYWSFSNGTEIAWCNDCFHRPKAVEGQLWTAAEEAAAVRGDRPRTRLLSLSELAELRPPRFLLQDFLRAQGFNVLYGPSGSGKSFLAGDWSLCTATGLPFYGQEVERGDVIYIAAEGAGGLYRRIEAWRLDRGVDPVEIEERLLIWPEAVNFFAGETAALVDAIAEREIDPALIVVDTMARCMVGGDENSAKDVGLYIDRVDSLARRHEASSLTVHHTGKNGELERGSSALRGAADTMASLKEDRAGLKLSCEKQKEWEPFDPWHLHLAEATRSQESPGPASTRR